MPFTGKATYSAGAELPEIAEDVADLVAIASGAETPLLDALGDAPRPARSVLHEWLEDAPLPNADRSAGPVADDVIAVEHPERFRVFDQFHTTQARPGDEVFRVEQILPAGHLRLARGYGNTPVGPLPEAGEPLMILGNAALEGGDAAPARFSTRARRSNVTQIFAATVEVSGSELAVRQAAVGDEVDYQKAMRTRELLRDLENSVINGVADADAANPAGSAAGPRTMRGIVASLSTHRFVAGVDGYPPATAEGALTEEQLNAALRAIWQNGGGGSVDLIVVGGRQKRAINNFVASNRRFASSAETFRDALSVYESDFGVCRVILSRWAPAGTALLLDSSRIGVVPLAGRSFAYKPLARTGDRETGQVIGEYTLEVRNEAAHGLVTGLAA